MLKDTQAFVFAGGRSSRMGRDKALVLLDGVTLVARAVRSLHRLTGKVTVIGRPDNLDRLKDVLPDAVEIITDLVPDKGPLMGVYTALLHAQREFTVCVPCDMPDVSFSLLHRLRGGLDGAADACAGETADGWQPFPLVCRTSAAAAVGALLDEGRSAMRDLLKGPRGRIVTLTDPGLLECYRNLNTPEDLRERSLHGLIAS